MGLDVYLVKVENGKAEPLNWDDPIMASFPLAKTPVQVPDDIDEYGDVVSEGYTQYWVVEITGMLVMGEVSFQGKGYDWFASNELPYSFYGDLSPEELKEQATALVQWLEQHSVVPEKEYHGQSLQRLRDLSFLLNWAVGNGLGTQASY